MVKVKWTAELVILEAKKHNNRFDFKKSNPYAYRKAIELELLDEACEHMGERKNEPYTLEEIKAEALKYSNRTSFDTNSNKFYRSAQRRGLLDQVCEHMTQLWEEKWVKEAILEESNKHSTKSGFAAANRSAYNAAHRLEITEEAFSHMALGNNTSISEQDMVDIVKKNYPKAQKLRVRNIEIPDKPHIKGFDIDIYIPELRKGIEFDGEYWHSVPGLKRSREHWPEIDLEQYHDIKDKYFLNKDIAILHINEKDWLKDKEQCLKKILAFLS